MHYIEVQQVDYDDYPMGRPDNIGPFKSHEEAEAYLEDSPRFSKIVWLAGITAWTAEGYGKRTVNIRNVDSLFIQPGTRGY